jgi:biofilm PGA synthesis protein PgaD
VSPLIIESPNLQELRQRYAFAALTLVFWVVWFYLWIPLVSLVAWLFGFELLYDQMMLFDGLRALRELLGWYALVIFLLGFSLGSWAWYNMKRFGVREKRRQAPTVTPCEIAERFGIAEEELTVLKRARHIVFSHDDNGLVCGIDLRNAGGRRATDRTVGGCEDG